MTKFDVITKDLDQAIRRLNEILRKPKNDTNRDSAIMRFILVFDLSWKTIKACLEVIGKECSSPRGCLEEAYQEKIIEYDNFWVDLIDWRKNAVHTYNGKLADMLYDNLPKALMKFIELQKVLKKLNKYGAEK